MSRYLRDHLHVRAIYFENGVTCGAVVGVEQGAMRGAEPAVQKAAEDGTPIGVYMNYAAHPINFYLTGVLSADFPGDVSTYVERRYDDKTVAIFSQGASGDQNARAARCTSALQGW